MSTNVLEDALCYLIGAIDAAGDQGMGWRKKLIEQCKAAGLSIIFLDPTDKITGLQSEVNEEHQRIMDYKANGQWDELSGFMRRIVREDHRSVDASDFVIFYLDPSIYTCGSFFELQSALTEKKPYYIICPQGKRYVPAWLFGICDHNNFYNSIEEVVQDLKELNSGDKALSDRWVLFRKPLKKLMTRN